jgi:hypothetical protein
LPACTTLITAPRLSAEPNKETGMENYRLDEREKPKHHPAAMKRLNERPRRPISTRGGELPERKIDGRRYLHRGRSACTALALR